MLSHDSAINHILLAPHPTLYHKLQPQTPNLEEDLKEVLWSETGMELIIEDDVKPEKQRRKQGVSI